MSFLESILRLSGMDSEEIELAVRHVRTPEGEKKYGLPIGSPIAHGVPGHGSGVNTSSAHWGRRTPSSEFNMGYVLPPPVLSLENPASMTKLDLQRRDSMISEVLPNVSPGSPNAVRLMANREAVRAELDKRRIAERAATMRGLEATMGDKFIPMNPRIQKALDEVDALSKTNDLTGVHTESMDAQRLQGELWLQKKRYGLASSPAMKKLLLNKIMLLNEEVDRRNSDAEKRARAARVVETETNRIEIERAREKAQRDAQVLEGLQKMRARMIAGELSSDEVRDYMYVLNNVQNYV